MICSASDLFIVFCFASPSDKMDRGVMESISAMCNRWLK